MEISIIIPVYNAEKYIARAIRSALNQTLDKKRFEVIVVDDGSTDNTSKIFDYYADKVKIVRLKGNRGLAHARNEGIRVSNGRYVVCLDADDYMHNDSIFIESTFLNMNPQWDAVSCDYYIVNEFESHIQRKNGEQDPIACGVMFRVERLIDIGLYDTNFRANEEKDLRIRFAEKYRISNIGLPLYRYRQHISNLTKDKKTMEQYSKVLKEKHNLQ